MWFNKKNNDVKVEVVDFKKEMKRRERKQKIEKAKQDFKNKIDNLGAFVWQNKELVFFFTPIVVGGVSSVWKVTTKNNQLKREENLKNLYCYDASMGHYWKLKRELTNSEWVQISNRKANGEKLADILDSLNVLK